MNRQTPVKTLPSRNFFGGMNQLILESSHFEKKDELFLLWPYNFILSSDGATNEVLGTDIYVAALMLAPPFSPVTA